MKKLNILGLDKTHTVLFLVGLFVILSILTISGYFFPQKNKEKKPKEVKTEDIPCNYNYIKAKVPPAPAKIPIPKPLNRDPNDIRNWKIFSNFSDKDAERAGKEQSNYYDTDAKNWDTCMEVNKGNLYCRCFSGGIFMYLDYTHKTQENYNDWLAGKLINL